MSLARVITCGGNVCFLIPLPHHHPKTFLNIFMLGHFFAIILKSLHRFSVAVLNKEIQRTMPQL